MVNDAKVRQDVVAELKWEPSVDAPGIAVGVKDGIVTLAGYVDSYAEKWHAGSAAGRVPGVKALESEIVVVARPGSGSGGDADIARSVESVLQLVAAFEEDPVKVMVEGGWVTLSGEVAADYRRRAASGPIRYLAGVMGISDDTTVRQRTERPAPEF